MQVPKVIKWTIGGAIAGCILGASWMFFFAEHTRNSSKEVAELRQEKIKDDKDRAVMRYVIENQKRENILIKKDRDQYKAKLDSSVDMIITITRPVIKARDKQEALKWAEEYNSQLK